MLTKTRRLLTAGLFAALILNAGTAGCFALPGKTAEAESPVKVSPEKRALLEELQKISDHNSTIERSWKILTSKLNEDLSKIYLKQLSNNTTISEDDKKAAVTEMVDSIMKNFSERFKPKFWELNKEVFISAYAKFFTDDEIKSLNDFYRSETARKSTQKMPEMIKNLVKELRAKIDPKIEKCVKKRLQDLNSESSEKEPTI